MRWGVREHAMAAVMNGMSTYGLIPFGGSFLNFMGYAMGAVRVGAISNFRTLYIMSHDSIGLGEDGPTHQPIETLVSMRAMPNLTVSPRLTPPHISIHISYAPSGVTTRMLLLG
eukprot:GFYU01009923.1.p1 GENE.GFYU01009923.1~~GFYU01009923.1.p1  ORF type:complete len:134 (+),score=16.39 GFYU01009923.1:61-402(+)